MFVAAVVSFAASCAALLGPQDPPQPASTGTLRLLGVTVHTGTDTPWTGVLGARHGRLAAVVFDVYNKQKQG